MCFYVCRIYRRKILNAVNAKRKRTFIENFKKFFTDSVLILREKETK